MSTKEKCFICGSIRGRKDMVVLSDGKVVHSTHKGIESEIKTNIKLDISSENK